MQIDDDRERRLLNRRKRLDVILVIHTRPNTPQRDKISQEIRKVDRELWEHYGVLPTDVWEG